MTALERKFPGLRRRPGHWERTSPATESYNCIAWAAQDKTRWWDPSRPETYWPDQAPRENTVAAYVAAFATLGYEPCGQDTTLDRAYEKVVIYAAADQPTHMARQLPDGRWTSKCGAGADIAHELAGLVGEEYGQPVLILRRRRT